MSSGDMSLEEALAIQVAYARAKGVELPTEMSAELEVDLRAILGDEEVDRICAEKGRRRR